MVVVDASTLIAAAVDSGPEGRWAERLLLTHPLGAPHLVLVEATNILRRLELRGEVSRMEATVAHRALLDLPLELYAFEPFADRVWELRGNVTAYDAWYVALAEALDVPVATLDVRLANASGPACDFLLPDG